MKKTLLVTLAILFSLVSFCYALETDTHEYINEYIARNTINGFSLNSYLEDQLEIQKGINEIYNTHYVWKWLKEGGRYEDKPNWYQPYLRSFNHYHNPLTDKGYKGTRDSSIQWSQRLIGTQSPGGHYSWHDVRGYFLNALTSQTKTDRDENFAETFRGLGQLMHLVQDLSVPAHTRDDGHVLYNYEDWVKGEIKGVSDISAYPPVSFDPSAIGNPNPLASVPIANLFDTNQYIEPNPEPSVTLRADIGLSEYTNANFFSRDTVFRDFPYPNSGSVQITDYEIQDPRDSSSMVFRQYYKKVSDGETGYRLAAVPFLKDYEINCAPFCTELLYEMAPLDKFVYGDYASKLIPRAVGYSAGLLNYFFRGKLEVELVDGGMKITNKSEEAMHDGVFKLYYDNEAIERQEIEIYFGAEVSTLAPNGEQTITFDPPGDTPSYIVVYTGGLGNETYAVVGFVSRLKACVIYARVTSGSYKWVIIWDPSTDDYAENVMKNSGEEVTEWPVQFSEISDWWAKTESIVQPDLFTLSEPSDVEYNVCLHPIELACGDPCPAEGRNLSGSPSCNRDVSFPLAGRPGLECEASSETEWECSCFYHEPLFVEYTHTITGSANARRVVVTDTPYPFAARAPDLKTVILHPLVASGAPNHSILAKAGGEHSDYYWYSNYTSHTPTYYYDNFRLAYTGTFHYDMYTPWGVLANIGLDWNQEFNSAVFVSDSSMGVDFLSSEIFDRRGRYTENRKNIFFFVMYGYIKTHIDFSTESATTSFYIHELGHRTGYFSPPLTWPNSVNDIVGCSGVTTFSRVGTDHGVHIHAGACQVPDPETQNPWDLQRSSNFEAALTEIFELGLAEGMTPDGGLSMTYTGPMFIKAP